MKNYGSDNKLKFEKPQQQPKTYQKHKRNAIWYNPSFSNSVKINIEKKIIWTKSNLPRQKHAKS